MVRKCCIRCFIKGNIFSFRVSKVDLYFKYFARVFNSYRFCSKAVGNSLVYYIKVLLVWVYKGFGQLKISLSNIKSSKYGEVCKGTDLLLIG